MNWIPRKWVRWAVIPWLYASVTMPGIFGRENALACPIDLRILFHFVICRPKMTLRREWSKPPFLPRSCTASCICTSVQLRTNNSVESTSFSGLNAEQLGRRAGSPNEVICPGLLERIGRCYRPTYTAEVPGHI